MLAFIRKGGDMERWILTFPRETYTGDTATHVLKRLSKSQFDPDDRRRIKRALAWRTWVLTREPLDEDMDDADFLMRFCELGMATLEVETDAGTIRIG
jgi:hypothetical protein